MKGRWKLGLTMAVAVLALALYGCSQSPVAPSSVPGGSNQASAPPIAHFADDGSVDYVAAPVGEEVMQPVNLTEPGSRALKVSMDMNGARGGYLRGGRFAVKIPAGAFEGDATVTLVMPDSTEMICDLSISPSVEKFSESVELMADLSGVAAVDASTFTMYWYDPAVDHWVNLSVKTRCSGSYVITSLEHFSTYGSGKAGW